MTAEALAQTFKPAGKIYGWPDSREFKTVGRTDVAVMHITEVKSDSEAKGRSTCPPPVRIQDRTRGLSRRQRTNGLPIHFRSSPGGLAALCKEGVVPNNRPALT